MLWLFLEQDRETSEIMQKRTCNKSSRQWPLSDVPPLSMLPTSLVTHDFRYVTRTRRPSPCTISPFSPRVHLGTHADQIKTKFRFSPPTKRDSQASLLLLLSSSRAERHSRAVVSCNDRPFTRRYFCFAFGSPSDSSRPYFDERESYRSSFYRDTFKTDKQERRLVHRSDIDPLLAGIRRRFRLKGYRKEASQCNSTSLKKAT